MKRRKQISILACLCLLLTMIPAAAFADDAGIPDSAPAQEVSAVEPSAPAVQPGEIQEPAAEETLMAEPAAPEETQPADELTAEPETMDPEDAAPPADLPEQNSDASSKRLAAAPVDNAPKPAASKEQIPVKTFAAAEKTASGIKVSGGIEGKDWFYDSEEQTLAIMKDGLTVSGTATDDLIILCAIAASTLTLDNLDQGKHIIMIGGGLDEKDNSSMTLIIKGKNDIMAAISGGNLTIVGKEGSSLNMQAAAASNNLNIRDANITAGFLNSGRDINISGKTKLTIKPTKELKPFIDMGLLPALILADHNINIDLAPGGYVKAAGAKAADKDALFSEVLPMMAMNKINLSKGSRILLPQGGKVGTAALLGILPVQTILNSNGSPALDITISNSNILTASASMSDASPQTGDSSTQILYILYVILAAAGTAALISRKKQHS